MAKRRSQTQYELKARRSCEAVCKPISEKGFNSFKAGKDKQADHYFNAYWHCVTDCFPTKLPKWHPGRRAKGRLRRKK